MTQVTIGESTCYHENTQTIQLGFCAWWQQKLLLETPIEDTLSHEIMHDVLFRLFGSKICQQYDFVSYQIECPSYYFWAVGEGLEKIRTREFHEEPQS